MTEQKNTPQEIDLIELFSNIWKWISKVFMSILYFFLRNALLFLAVVILSGGLGFISFKLAKPYYKSELFGLSNTISNVEVIQYINNWNYDKEFKDESLIKIKDISAKYVLDLNKDGIWDVVEKNSDIEITDTAAISKRMYGAFCIQAELYDTTLVRTIREKVFNHLEKNQRVIEMNEIRLTQIKSLIPKIEKEISDLDSLKSVQYFEQNNRQGKAGDMLILNEKDVNLYYKDIIDLYKQQQYYERQLFLSTKPFEITQDFTIPRYQVNSMSVLLMQYIKVGLIIGFFFILLWDNRKLVKRLLKESSTKR